MITFRQFLEQDAPDPAAAPDPAKKLAPYNKALTSVLNIDPKIVDDAIGKMSPVFSQAVFGKDQIGLSQFRIEPTSDGMYKISLISDEGDLLYKDGVKKKDMKLVGIVDANTLNRILTQGLAGWNNEPKKS